MNIFPSPPQALASALKLTHDGSVISVISDDLCVFSSTPNGAHLESAVEPGSREKLRLFLETTNLQGVAMGWELQTLADSRVRTLHFFGVRKSDHIFVILSQFPENILVLYEQMVDILNEQGVMLRQCQQALKAPMEDEAGDDDLAAFMKLNNELINAQRELTLRNHMLKMEKERTNQLFEFNPDALLVLSEDGSVIAANSAAKRLFGEDMDALPAVRLKIFENIDGCTEICVRSDAREHVLECRSLNMDWDGQPVCLVSMRDITDRKELEELKEDVDRIARHDLKSPLAGVVSLSNHLARVSEGDAAECAKLIAQASSSVLDMVNDSLSLYHMECGTYALKHDEVVLEPILKQIILDNDIIIQSKNLEVELQLDEQGMTLRGEQALYRSMLSNIIKNAVEAAPDESSVFVNARIGESQSTISVNNMGTVPKQIRETFFDKYATYGKKHGSGLGTYSARLVAQTLGGSLQMQTSEKAGTTLLFSLPYV